MSSSRSTFAKYSFLIFPSYLARIEEMYDSIWKRKKRLGKGFIYMESLFETNQILKVNRVLFNEK